MRYSGREYIELMSGRGGRPMLCELFGPLVGLAEEWAAQGATPDELSLRAFGFDSVDYVDVGGDCGAIRLKSGDSVEDELIREDDSVRITRDGFGRVMILHKNAATIPLPLEYPVKTMDDWLKFKPRFNFNESRVDAEAADYAARRRKGGALTRIFIPGAFSMPRELMGDEAVCLAFYDEPELLRDMLSTFTTTSVEVIRRIGRVVPVDNLAVSEDLAGKSGPLMGPSHVREFAAPYYQAVWDAARETGASLFSQDSDGYVEPVMEAFMACGVNVFYPCEPAAGMDIVKLRARFGGRCAYKGGIDKHALRGSFDDIERELQYKLTCPALRTGEVFGLDHRIPNGVPIENYRFYVRRARELLGLPPDPAPADFVRMAF